MEKKNHLTMQMILKSLIWNKFVDEQALIVGDAISHQRDQMSMMDTTDNFNFSLKFPITLSTTGL
jgi:hypothetical protein